MHREQVVLGTGQWSGLDQLGLDRRALNILSLDWRSLNELSLHGSGHDWSGLLGVVVLRGDLGNLGIVADLREHSVLVRLGLGSWVGSVNHLLSCILSSLSQRSFGALFVFQILDFAFEWVQNTNQVLLSLSLSLLLLGFFLVLYFFLQLCCQ